MGDRLIDLSGAFTAGGKQMPDVGRRGVELLCDRFRAFVAEVVAAERFAALAAQTSQCRSQTQAQRPTFQFCRFVVVGCQLMLWQERHFMLPFPPVVLTGVVDGSDQESLRVERLGLTFQE